MQSPPSNPPDWVSESKVIAEALSYARTFRDAARNPWKFASEWASGTRQTMNPLTFFSITVGVFVAGAHQRKVVTAIAWCLSFYLLLVVIGLGLVAAGSALKAL